MDGDPLPCADESRPSAEGTRRTAERVEVVEDVAGAASPPDVAADDGRRTADRVDGVAGDDGAAEVVGAACPAEVAADLGRRTAERGDAVGAGAADGGAAGAGCPAEATGARRCAARGVMRTTGASDPVWEVVVRAAGAVRTCDGVVERTPGVRGWAGAVRPAGPACAGLGRTVELDAAGAGLERAAVAARGDVERADEAGRAGSGADRGAGAERVCGAGRDAGAGRAGAGLGARRGCAWRWAGALRPLSPFPPFGDRCRWAASAGSASAAASARVVTRCLALMPRTGATPLPAITA